MKIEKVIDIFQKLFPHEKLVTLNEKCGNEHDVVEINDRWICKSGKTQEAAILIARDVQLLQLLHGKITICIPQVLFFEEGLLIYEKIVGVSLTLDFFSKLNQNQMDNLAAGIGLFLYELHNALPMNEVQGLGFEKTNWPWAAEKLQKAVHSIDQDLKNVFDIFITDYTHQSAESNAALLHNDMAYQNIIVDEVTGKLHGIIDFTDAAIGNPHLDLRGRGQHDQNLTRLIVDYYAHLSHQLIDYKKIENYYLATEFSRYFEYVQEGKLDELADQKDKILDFIKNHS